MKRFSYQYVFLLAFFLLFGPLKHNLTSEPFMIDAIGYINKSDANKLLGTKQTYSFRLLNKSKYDIELTDIKLEDYAGLEVGKITTSDGVDFTNKSLFVPSHTGYETGQGINFNYDVSIIEPNIFNPKKISLTYKFFGIKRIQTIELPTLEYE